MIPDATMTEIVGTESGMMLTAIERPNGKLYRPRKIQTITTGNEDEVTGIAVFGTHDVRFAENEARHHAADYATRRGIKLAIDGPGFKDWYGTQIAGSTDEGRPLVVFVTDEVRGRACVHFCVEEIGWPFPSIAVLPASEDA